MYQYTREGDIPMAYEIVSGIPAVIGGNNVAGFLEARDLRKAPPACPPLKFPFDSNCPFSLLEYGDPRKDLCDRISGAINLAKRAAARLKPPKPDTVTLFRQVFGPAPTDPWEIPGRPGRTMPAGDMVARRFRTIANEMETGDTIYRCVSANRCRSPSGSPGGGGKGPGETAPGAGTHPTETIVIDRLAMALLCKNEVWLCPGFWLQLKPEWQESTIIHEMLHLRFGLTCAWFQHDHKEKTRNSAYCYEAFALMIDNKVPEQRVITECRNVLRTTTP